MKVVGSVVICASLALCGWLASGCGGSKPGTTSYPADIYLPPVAPGRGITLDMSSECPNPLGLRDQGAPGEATLSRVFAALMSGSVSAMRHASDRALWPNLHPDQVRRPLRVTLSTARPARQSPYAAVIRAGCGHQTLALSWYVMECPSSCRRAVIHSPALIGYLYLVNRRGRWLAWAEE
jgi:hypothetical protein